MRLIRHGVSLFAVLMLAVVILGCPKKVEEQIVNAGGGDTFAPSGHGIGEDCATSAECRAGLECAAGGVCEAGYSQGTGQACLSGVECQKGLYCDGLALSCLDTITRETSGSCTKQSDCPTGEACVPAGGRCKKAGAGSEGAPCSADGDCQAELACGHATGFTGACAPTGTVDAGKPCETTTECAQGLLCGPSGTCIGFVEAIATLGWGGVECEEEPQEAKAVAYFEVPGESGLPKHDFYRLPFPNDIRLGGKLTAGHPTPGRSILDFDPVQRLLDAVNGLDAFGTTPTIFFRFSQPLDFDSVDYTQDEVSPANLYVVNIDPASPGYKSNKGFAWGASDGKQRFVCQNWLSVSSHPQDPYESGRTYAVIMKKGLKVRDGGPVYEPDADFQALIAASPPTDGRLAGAYAKYAGLRQYLADSGTPASSLLSASVFTVMDPAAIMSRARDVVRALPAPELTGAVVCGAGVTSPCEDGENPKRACGTSSAFWEVHAKLSLPSFQTGTPPFIAPGDGGAIQVGPGGAPQVVGSEDVCVAIAIPKGPMPSSGWPLVMYAHGTGGSFRSHVDDGTAALGTKAGAVVIGIDGVMHGPRRHSKLDPEALVYNFGNPAAGRGNITQGAIDGFTVVRLAETLDQNLGTGESVKLDATRVAFIGHSQGSQTGPLFVAFEPLVGAVVLSGAGAGLINGVINKKSPVNVGKAIEAALGEGVSPSHPVLSLVQQYFDPVDPLNYGRFLTKSPPETAGPRHVLVAYGQGDTFTPPQTTRTLADVLGISVMTPGLDLAPSEPFEGISVVPGPLQGNATVAGTQVTHGMTHYAPDGYDGHFVLFKNVKAQSQVGTFLSTFLQGAIPTIPVQE